MALSRSMKNMMREQYNPGTKPMPGGFRGPRGPVMQPQGPSRVAGKKPRPGGTFGTALSEMRQRRQPLSARGRAKGQVPGRNQTAPVTPPRSKYQGSSGVGGMVRNAVGQAQQRFQAGPGAKPQPSGRSRGGFGFLDQGRRHPAFGRGGSRQYLR